jgi:hypothetical protein
MMNPNPRTQRLLAVGITCAALLTFVFSQGCRQGPDEDGEEEEGVAATAVPPARITVQNGQMILTLEAGAQRRLDLAVLSPSASSVQIDVTAPAVVLSAQGLANLRDAYIAGQTQLQKARVTSDVARKEYLRLKTLYQENQNASLKAMESAEATAETTEADDHAAQQRLDLQTSIARQQWGEVVTNWVTSGSSALASLLARREMLVQVTISPAGSEAPPAFVSLELPAGGRAAAKFVSEFPRVDPRIQGQSLLYITAGRADLAPGVNLVAHMPEGKRRRGLIIPQSAVVWSEGEPWVFLQTSDHQFTRRSLPTDTPVAGGFLVTQGFSPRDRIVVRGAQSLLSEELILQGAGMGETD